MSTPIPLPLDGYGLADGARMITRIDGVFAEPDGEAWGFIPMEEVQRRLVEADDFAVLQLWFDLYLRMPVDRLYVDVNDQGIRTLDLKGTYGVPVRGLELPKDQVRYLIEKSLEPGVHRLIWSYAWNPPKDSSGEPTPDGVELRPLRIFDLWSDESGALHAVPPTITLSKLRGAVTRLGRTIDVPSNARSLHIETLPSGAIRPSLDGESLASIPNQVGHFQVPSGAASRMLQLDLGPDFVSMKSMSWHL
jgi:hypothetical protein